MPQIPSSPQPIQPSGANLKPAAQSPSILPETQLIQTYIVQQDNTRVALPAGQSLASVDWLGDADQNAPLARLEAHFELSDIDGIDQKSSFDLQGEMDLTLKLERKLFQQAVSEANKNNPDLNFGLSFNPKNSTYSIPVKYKSFVGKVEVARVDIRPMSNGRLKVEVGGLAGGAASVLNALSFGTLKSAVQDMITGMSNDMGFKVQANSISDYVLSPDIENSPLFQEIAFAGGETLKLESVTSKANSLLSMKADTNGDFTLRLKDVNVVASSQTGGKRAVADAEGADSITIDASAKLFTDYSSEVTSKINLSLNVQESEKAGLSQRLKGLTGQTLPVSGQLKIDDLEVTTRLNAKGKPVAFENSSGHLSAQNLSLDMGSTAVDLSRVEGDLALNQSGHLTQIGGRDMSLAGTIKSPEGTLNISDLSLSGSLKHDDRKPNQVGFSLADGQSLAFSGSIQQGSQKMDIKGLNVSRAELQTDLATGKLELKGANSENPRASLQSLTMPGTNIKNLQLSGTLSADLNSGSVEMNARNVSFTGQMQDFKLSKFSGGGKLSFDPSGQLKMREGSFDLAGSGPGIEIKQLKGSGNLDANLNTGKLTLNARSISLAGKFQDFNLTALKGSGKVAFDPASGLSLRDGSFDLTGEVQGVKLETLKGKGSADISLEGQVKLHQVKDLELVTDQGISLRGDFSGEINPTGYTVQTLSDNARLDLDLPGFQLKDLAVQGKVEMDAAGQNLRFSGTGDQNLKLGSGRIGDLELKNVSLNGQLEYTPEALVFSPQNGQLTASGKLGEVDFSQIKTDQPVQFDMKKQELRWTGETSGSLPKHGIESFKTSGPVQLTVRQNGDLAFQTNGSKLSATLGQIKLDQLETHGTVVFNPNTGELHFEGEDGKGLQLKGNFNGRPLDISSSGKILIAEKSDRFEITGAGIQLKGLVDGFTLSNPEGAGALEGKVSVKKDFSGFELQDLNFGFQVDDIGVSNQGGTIKSTPEGIEIQMHGKMDINREQIGKLVQKLSQRADFGEQFKAGLNQMDQGLDAAFVDFENADLNFENLKILIDPQTGMKSFSLENRTEIDNARMQVELNGKKMTLPMGKVEWDADVQGSPGKVEVHDGQLRFSLTEDLREKLADEAEKMLEDGGLKKVELEILPNGKVNVLNATVNRKKLNINASLELSTRIVDNQLEVSLDKLKLKNFLFNVVSKVIDAPDKVADEVDVMMKEQEVKYQRRNRKGEADPESGRVFSIDLAALLKRIDPGVKLENAILSPEGQVQIDYSFAREMK